MSTPVGRLIHSANCDDTRPSLLGAWENFFQSCDLPANVCKSYAQRFVKERMQPYMLKEIGKDELRELGISAMGDQLAILRYMKLCNGNPQEFRSIGKGRASSADEDEEVEAPTKSRFVAPDRDEIYHVRMPAGNNPKTRKILEKQSVLREKGLIKRGVTGIRVSGVEVLPSSLSKISNSSRSIRKQTKAVMIQDISSSSPMAKTGSMRSDQISSKTTVVASTPTIKRPKVVTSDVVGRNIGVPPQAQRMPTSSSSSNPNFRVRLDINDINPTSNIAHRLSIARKTAAQRLQRVVVPQQQQRLAQRVVASTFQNQRLARRVVAVPVAGRSLALIPRASAIQKRKSILNRITIRP